jgi:unsaturated rhamnogalacturonyl hydrolase
MEKAFKISTMATAILRLRRQQAMRRSIFVLLVVLLSADSVVAQLHVSADAASPLQRVTPAAGLEPTWPDSLDAYARNVFLPARKFHWSWQQAAFLRAMTQQYDGQVGADRAIYLDYVRTAMDKTMAHPFAGHNPNGIAAGFGLAWLARTTGEARYRLAADDLYQNYLQIPREANGGVTHLRHSLELWDDTIFMVGIYLLEMFLLTDDEKYLDELLLQVSAHREKLRVTDPATVGAGLWVHGWDGDTKSM